MLNFNFVMSRLYTVLNYFCIAICAVGIYSSYRLLSLKPWKVNDLETKLVAQFEKWEAPALGDAQKTERELGEKKPDPVPVEKVANKPVVDAKPIVANPVAVVQPEKKAPAPVVKIAKVEPKRTKPAVSEPGKQNPVVAVAKVAPKQLKPVFDEPKKADSVVAIAKVASKQIAPMATEIKKTGPIVQNPVKVAPGTQSKLVAVVAPKKAIPIVIAKIPEVQTAPTVVGAPSPAPEAMLLANANTNAVKAPSAPKNFPKTNTQNATQTRPKTEKSPLRERERSNTNKT